MNIPIPQTHGEMVKTGMTSKARAGIPTGPVPLGYKKVRDSGHVSVKIDESIAPLVQEAFRLAALKRQSLRKILQQLDGYGLLSRHGKSLSTTAVWRILTNPFYMGEVLYDGQLFQGRYEPLISRTVFAKAQQNLALRQRKSPGRRRDQDCNGLTSAGDGPYSHIAECIEGEVGRVV